MYSEDTEIHYYKSFLFTNFVNVFTFGEDIRRRHKRSPSWMAWLKSFMSMSSSALCAISRVMKGAGKHKAQEVHNDEENDPKESWGFGPACVLAPSVCVWGGLLGTGLGIRGCRVQF